MRATGCLAQLVEHRPYKARVGGSIPSAPTKFGAVVQLVRIPACHAGGRGFESRPLRQHLVTGRLETERPVLVSEPGDRSRRRVTGPFTSSEPQL